jgi:hypothetical protein
MDKQNNKPAVIGKIYLSLGILNYKNKYMSHFNSLFYLTHPKLVKLAFPLSTSREGGCPLADMG